MRIAPLSLIFILAAVLALNAAAAPSKAVVATIVDDSGKTVTLARVQARYSATPGTYVPKRPEDVIRDGLAITLVASNNIGAGSSTTNIFVAFSEMQSLRVERRGFVLDVSYHIRKRNGTTIILAQNVTRKDFANKQSRCSLSELNAQGKETKTIQLREFCFCAGYGGSPGYEYRWDLVELTGAANDKSAQEKPVTVPFYHISEMVFDTAEGKAVQQGEGGATGAARRP